MKRERYNNMATRKGVTKEEKNQQVDKYIEAMKDISQQFMPKPFNPADYPIPEVPKFSIHKITEVENLAEDIMKLLDGKEVRIIITAIAIVENYISQQSGMYISKGIGA